MNISFCWRSTIGVFWFSYKQEFIINLFNTLDICISRFIWRTYPNIGMIAWFVRVVTLRGFYLLQRCISVKYTEWWLHPISEALSIKSFTKGVNIDYHFNHSLSPEVCAILRAKGISTWTKSTCSYAADLLWRGFYHDQEVK